MYDTTAEAAEVQARALRRLTPEARVAMALEASDWLRRLALAGTHNRLTDAREESGTSAKRTSAGSP